MRYGDQERLNEAIDLIEELVCQSCWSPDGEGAGRDFGHSFISTYEQACSFLAQERPERWKLLPWGISLIEESSRDAIR